MAERKKTTKKLPSIKKTKKPIKKVEVPLELPENDEDPKNFLDSIFLTQFLKALFLFIVIILIVILLFYANQSRRAARSVFASPIENKVQPEPELPEVFRNDSVSAIEDSVPTSQPVILEDNPANKEWINENADWGN
jgi:hypothetical protein|tara:strand:+ start:3882 stop:4292 length:411 start_codon:yes stop_codon:yes gene_type:complete